MPTSWRRLQLLSELTAGINGGMSWMHHTVNVFFTCFWLLHTGLWILTFVNKVCTNAAAKTTTTKNYKNTKMDTSVALCSAGFILWNVFMLDSAQVGMRATPSYFSHYNVRYVANIFCKSVFLKCIDTSVFWKEEKKKLRELLSYKEYYFFEKRYFDKRLRCKKCLGNCLLEPCMYKI